MQKKKIYVLDTNVLIQDPNCLYSFEDNTIVIPDVVLEELDKHKTKEGDLGHNAREVCRVLESLRHPGNLYCGVETPSGGNIFVKNCRNDCSEIIPQGWDKDKADNRILAITKSLSEEKKGCYVAIVTQDINTRLKADAMCLNAEEYRTERVTVESTKYTGRREMIVPSGVIKTIYDCKETPLEDISENEKLGLQINEFICMIDEVNPKHSALARFDGKTIRLLEHLNDKPSGMIPRNNGQRFAQEALLAPPEQAPLVILKGPAGTGKTLCAIASGLHQIMETGLYKKIVITRANVKMDADIGYLKGDMESKLTPLFSAMFDNLEILLDESAMAGKGIKDDYNTSHDKIQELFDRGYIEMEALAYLRGRSLANTYLIVDEAQNATPGQIKSIITRCGIGSKVVLCGDTSQIDNPRLNSRTNGLAYASEKMLGSTMTWQVSFTQSECVRSELAKEAATRMK
jgi:PhoH-like ATPase